MTGPELVYKVMTQTQWDGMQAAGSFEGATIDLQDGFIHLSAAHQLVETVTKHFFGQKELVVIAVDSSSLGDTLHWEVSRGGDLFPHLYAALSIVSVRETFVLPMNEDGSHRFPEGPWKSTTG